MHIVRIANFVSPTSGGIKTALREWGQVYRARGHQVSLVIPGPGEPESEEPQGKIYRVGALPVGSSGYSLIWKRSEITALLDRLQPDSIEVSDRSTLRWTGAWARKNGVGSIMISHENLTGIMDRRTPVPAKPAHFLANVVNGRSAKAYDMIVAPSEYSAQEFHRMGVPAEVVPLGVDLETFAPGRPDPRLMVDPRTSFTAAGCRPKKPPVVD
ncbi:glycosyltransferase [Ornithinimicrobium sp. INDO-MA30-4]|uniref:glycosyltransferase n=1 Tax=Ornithinimicrobium sp. INDO-MA30-4 TaxID=2908651 RepID=UPI001F28AF35|nr:glycosyltransferase [Ornithinimicrobium sp. INDO-MA30-4]UJH70923.1 glycosyltransferase [Ornithinimicrobium sp. INDO-MA30-4]